MRDDPSTSHGATRLDDLRAAAEAAAGFERAIRIARSGEGGVPTLSPAEAAGALEEARRSADAAARAILAAPPSLADPAARHEARLWLARPRAGSRAAASGPGPVGGSLAAVDAGALVATIETVDGLAAIHALALGLAESCTLRGGPPLEDPDAAFSAGLLGRFGHALAAAAAERLEETRPASQADARLRAASLIAQAVSRGDGRALERAAMIAMEAGLEMYELED
ncbi:hypothetical protein [Salinarimonas sp.]|uniref:hypothetical protein n=1 Tax=Salinarimonas sp. TaxID=2766526 RepID=UPI0032D96C09